MATLAEPPRHDLDLETLDRVQRRVLWLAAAIVHHANRVRPNASGVKVGGHQASSASMVSLMTALWFAHLEAPDRVSVKPHASPVLHAINHLLGRLDRRYLTTLREFGGLQSYPSRTKDPDPVDYSTGSVGLGATAPVWGALAHRYVAGHFDVPVGGRQIALIGDAELDEGACWEAIADPMVAKLGEVMWVVDLNRQSLDRVVPDIAAGRLAAMFEAAGWHCVMVKYGPRLAGHPPLRERVDAMPNEEYQRLLRAGPAELRERLEVDVSGLADGDLLATFRDLGGHDLGALIDAYRQADAVRDRPSVVFAYTIKGWSLPTEGHPANHSALLNARAVRAAGHPARHRSRGPVGAVRRREPGGRAVRVGRAPAGAPGAAAAAAAVPCPTTSGASTPARASTQQAFGRFFVDLVREAPDGGRARGHRLARRRHVDQPRRLDQQAGHLVAGRPHRLVRRRHRHARALAGVRPRAPHRARDRRGQPRRPARRAGRDVVARRAAAAAGRDDLRPVRRPRAGAVVVRRLRRRAVDPRRHAERRHARARGRRPPVGDHAVDRDRAAGLRRLGAGLRAGPRVDAAARAVAARAPRRQLGLLPPLHAPDRPGPAHRHARGGARGRLPAAGRRRSRRGDRGDGRAGARGAGRRRRARRRGRRQRRGRVPDQRRPGVPLLPGARRAWARATRRRSSGCSRTAPRSSRCSTAIPTRWPSSARWARGIACLGVQRFGQSGDIGELYEHHQIDAESVVGAALDLLDG